MIMKHSLQKRGVYMGESQLVDVGMATYRIYGTHSMHFKSDETYCR